MPTATEPAPTHDVPSRGLRNAKVPAVLIVAASLTTLVVVFGIMNSPDDDAAQVQSIPAQQNTVSQWVAAPLPPPKPRAPVAAAPPSQSAEFPIDEQGFVDTKARCDEGQQAVAIARTTRAVMVVCRGTDDTYEYEGVRLSDGAFLRLDDVRPLPAGFEAHNDGTTYRLSATELVVITGENLTSRDAVVDYRAG
jgi:hypothetical protein